MSRATLNRRLMKLVMTQSSHFTNPTDAEEARQILRERLLGGPPVTGRDFRTFTDAELAAMPPLHRKLLAPFNG